MKKLLILLFIQLALYGCDNNNSDVVVLEGGPGDSLAYSDIYFGMTRMEYDSLVKDHYLLGEYKFYLTPEFGHNGKLHSIQLKSGEIPMTHSESIEVLMDMKDAITEPIKLKYGDHPITDDNFDDGTFTVASWKIGPKLINVHMISNSPSISNYVMCEISNQKFISEDSLYRVRYKNDLYQKQKDNF